MLTASDAAVWRVVVDQVRRSGPRPRRWASPLDMACDLDPTVVRTPALELINRALVEVADGREDRLIVSIPPQEGKSSTIAYRFPMWLLADVNPDLRILIVSYSDDIARRWGADIKRDFESFTGDDDTIDLGVRLRADSRAAGRWQVEGRRGGCWCGGVAGSWSGRAADLILIDDPIKDLEQAQSPIYRDRFRRFWQGVAVPRLAPDAKVITVQTRWHEDDAVGWLLQTEGDRAKGGRWRVINIPAQAEDGDEIGRPPGEYLTSARGHRDWAAIRRSVGEYVWAALYQGRPAPAEGGLFKRLWWRYWSPGSPFGHRERVMLGQRAWPVGEMWRFITGDLAASTRTSSDYTVAAAWGLTLDGDLVLLDLNRARVEEGQHFNLFRPLADRWATDTIFLEKSQHGTTLVAEATRSGLHVTPLTADVDKVSRAIPASARASGGRIWLPAGASWLPTFLDETAAFPNGRHDDICDVIGYACRVAVTKWQPPPIKPAAAQGDDLSFLGTPTPNLMLVPL